jgi:ribosomal-protein-alanine N-acetyltransferase
MVRIRPYRPGDYPQVRRWIDDPYAYGPFPQAMPAHTDGDVRRLVAGEREPNIVRFAVDVDDRVLGEVQYRHGFPVCPPGAYELGITLWDPAERGKGYGREAQRQLVDMLFRDAGTRRIQAGTHPENVAERRCLEALGFAEEGTMRAYFPGRDGAGDIVMYGLLRAEWERAHPRPPTRPAVSRK